MTRQKIAEGLSLLVMNLASGEDPTYRPSDWEPYEWAYVKGIASGEILRLRARLCSTGNSPTSAGLAETHGGA
jgi:hypothetical protein